MTVLYLCLVLVGQAQEGANAPDPAAIESPREPNDADDASRRKAFTVGVVMLGGILIAATGLVALVLIWGHRARRLAREPLPPVARQDELWFLKKPKPEPTPEAGQQDRES